MGAVREWVYPNANRDNQMFLEIIKNTKGDNAPKPNKERGINCHITNDWSEWDKVPQIMNFITWLEEVTELKLDDIWGVHYEDQGAIKWHNHHNFSGCTHSFAYYVNTPPNSSAICFARDPNDSDTWVSIPAQDGHVLVWEKELPHCVPPSDHAGRCVISGNLK